MKVQQLFSLVFIVGALYSLAANSAPISATQVFIGSGWSGSAHDVVTGKWYRQVDWNGNPGEIYVYDSEAAFRADQPSTTITAGGLQGTYFEVHNGILYGGGQLRYSDDGGASYVNYDSVFKWSATDGSRLPGYAISNGNTMAWGGQTYNNLTGSGSNVYNIVNKGGSIYAFDVATDLTLTYVGQYDAPKLGYAFVINDYLFAADNYNDGHITHRMNLLTGQYSQVDFEITGFGTGIYLSNASYDSATDTLFFWDSASKGWDATRGDPGLFEIQNASSQFGVSSVPVPAAIWMFGSSLVGLIGLNRKR